MRRSMTGFTLMELLVVITIVGIMAAIAIPSFSNFINQTRVTRVKMMLASDINTARSEAIKTNAKYNACPSNSGATDCSTGTDWAANGWLICAASGAGCSSAASIVVVRPPVTNGISITGSNITFTPIGAAVAAQTITVTGAANTTSGSLSVANTGAVSTQ